MKNLFQGWFYEYIGEAEDFKPWMGVASIEWMNSREKKTLMVCMPFNRIVYYWKKLYERMLVGKVYSCPACKRAYLQGCYSLPLTPWTRRFLK